MRKQSILGTMMFMAVIAMFASIFVLTSDLKGEIASLKSDVSDLKQVSTNSVAAPTDSRQDTSLIRGWAVRIFEAPRHRQAAGQIGNEAYAGAFIHTGSWISLADYKKHEGIFFSGDAAMNLRGLFRPADSGKYVFAVHMKVVSDIGDNAQDDPMVSCYAHLADQTGQELLNGKMLVDGKHPKGALISKIAVNASRSDAKALSLSFVCDGQRQLDGEKILFRLCFRKAGDAKFQPLVPNLRV
jgi:hypothetical protein